MTCSPCLDGRHFRCERAGCPCNICAGDKPKARRRPGKKRPSQRKERLPGEKQRGGVKPMTKAEGDKVCEDTLDLLQRVIAAWLDSPAEM